MADARVCGYCLAGGASSRMGTDKAALLFFGKPLVDRAVDRLRLVASHVRICGGSIGREPDDSMQALIRLADAAHRVGPMGGIVSALHDAGSHGPNTLAVVLAVDLPLVPWELLNWLMLRARMTHAAATIPRVADRPQPLCAVYSARLAPGMQAALSNGDHKVMRAVQQVCSGEAALDVFDLAGVLPPEKRERVADWFLNVNTPEDLRLAEAAADRRPVW